MRKAILLVLVLWQPALYARAQNPLIMDQFTADPSARVFGDSIYLYASHDIHWTTGNGRPNWFCMEDYHVFSSTDLTHWRDHGLIVNQTKVPWVDPARYTMWAPDMLHLATDPLVLGALPEKGLKEGPFRSEHKGKYYLTYPHVDGRIERREARLQAVWRLGPWPGRGRLDASA